VEKNTHRGPVFVIARIANNFLQLGARRTPFVARNAVQERALRV
jgi:hypothetical protein